LGSSQASVVEGGDHSGCTTPQAALPPHRRRLLEQGRGEEAATAASLEVCNARVWLLEAQLDAKEQELRRMKQELEAMRQQQQQQ
jgi:hypothetical protein